ncbi:hypothetical protein QA600_01340 [Natronococcus sp. A-GB1]|uniref:hypothetical protein n=1 Tax=Natronococcus sp. A-GB1 TaxID=3037648 RepID=UPI00241FEC34|nr:hypothetical protein [Natronococcus sp. A-GB1]MDG5757980.1 hypothetical protein [Natronococcus sp. A-GB1]
MRRSHAVAVALVVVAVLFIGGPSLLFADSVDEQVTEDTQETPELVSLEDSESEFWRFLSPEEEFHERSPINVIVRGESEDVLRAMSEQGDGDWEEIEEVEEEVEEDAEDGPGNGTVLENNTVLENTTVLEEHHRHATGIAWGEADGTTRYAWVNPGEGEDGYWATESLQLEEGDYYGQRYHIRLYESPNADDEWIAMQAHTEHFDWFTLRHRVDGVEAAQTKVEQDFMNLPGVDAETDVRRIHIDNAGPSDADGWTTVVDLTSMVVLPAGVGLAAGRRYRRSAAESVGKERPHPAEEGAPERGLTDVDRRRLAAAYDRLEAGHLVLVFAILALFLGVRMGGLLLERRASFLTPHMIAALLYPVIAVGIPVATYLIARGLTSRLDAAIAAAGSLSLAIWLDYGLLGVDVIRLDVVLQRSLVVIALGLIAAGAAKRATRESRFNDLLLAGVAMWVLVLVGTLFGYL